MPYPSVRRTETAGTPAFLPVSPTDALLQCLAAASPNLRSHLVPASPQISASDPYLDAVTIGDRALILEHVGSTSVPGLLAKPIIDILVVVPDSSHEPGYIPALEAAGYTVRIREPDWHEHRLLKGPGRDINLHVFSPGSPEIDRMLRFRDHLRANPAARDRYAETKRDLATHTWTHVQHYADAKTTVVESILAAATGQPT